MSDEFIPGVSGGAFSESSAMQAVDDATGTWYQGKLFEWPPELMEWKEAVNDAAMWLIAVLEVAASILEFVKAFLMAFLNPLATLLSEIIRLINQFLKDLQQMGIYFHGDHWLLMDGLTWPWRPILGGYGAYERRMAARLRDTQDPDYPNVSSLTPVIGVFFYASDGGAIAGVIKILKLIRQFIRFFTLKFDSKALPACTMPVSSYGIEGMSAGSIGATFSALIAEGWEGTVPKIAHVNWNISKAKNTHPYIVLPTPPPDGFLIEVSTVPQGISLWVDRPHQSKGAGKTTQTSGKEKKEQRQQIPLMAQNSPVVIYGGADSISMKSGGWPAKDTAKLGWNYNTEKDGSAKEGRKRVYGRTGTNTPIIDPNLLREGDKYYMQRSFVIGQANTTLSLGGTYKASLKIDDLPYACEWEMDNKGKIKRVNDDAKATTYYIRVSTISDDAENSQENRFWTGSWTEVMPSFSAKWNLEEVGDVPGAGPPLLKTKDVDEKGKPRPETPMGALVGPPSPLGQITFPDANTEKYLEAVTTSLAILCAVRPDLVPFPQLVKTVSKSSALKDNKEAESQNKDRPILQGDGKAWNAAGDFESQWTEKNIKETKTYVPGKLDGKDFGLAGVALEACNLEHFLDMLKELTDEDLAAYYRSKHTDWSIYDKCRALAEIIYDKTGPMPAVEKVVVENSEELRTTTWKALADAANAGVVLGSFGSMTIGEGFEASDDDVGVCKNLISAGNVDNFQSGDLANLIKAPTSVPVWKAKKNTVSDKVLLDWGDVTGELKYQVDRDKWQINAVICENDTDKFKKIIEKLKKELDDPTPRQRKKHEKKRPALVPGWEIGQYDTKSMWWCTVTKNTEWETDDLQQFPYTFDLPVVVGTDFDDALAKFRQGKDAGHPIVFARDLFMGSSQGKTILSQASMCLGVCSAFRPNNDGGWWAYRFFDEMPNFMDVFETINQWIAAINAAIGSVIQVIIDYIDFILARIRDLQRLIAKINEMIQAIVLFDLPRGGMLLTYSNGTSGVLADFMAAENKPSDPNNAYSMGCVAVIPLIPAMDFFLDMILGAIGGDGEGADDGIEEGL